MKKEMALFWVLALALAASCCGGKAPAGPAGKPFPYQRLGNIDRTGFPEPSGLVFHPGRGTLFVVGDSGDLGELRTDGEWVKQGRVVKADFEGVTCDPATGLLYVAVEGQEEILEIDPESFEVRRTFPLKRSFGGIEVLARGKQGIEGVAFAPAAGHPEGGVFYVVNQAARLDRKADLSAICEVELPLRSSTGDGEVPISRYFEPGVVDLSGIFYDAAQDLLYVISDTANLLLEVSRSGTVLQVYELPEKDQEGIALDGEGFLYIARDSGGIVKYRKKSEMEP